MQFLLTLNILMAGGILYCLNLNLKESDLGTMSHLRQSSKYITTVNSFQPLPIFRYKQLHLKCCIGLELHIITSTKILKSIGGYPSTQIIECNLGKT